MSLEFIYRENLRKCRMLDSIVSGLLEYSSYRVFWVPMGGTDHSNMGIGLWSIIEIYEW
jgi:hypothetical protein